MISLSKIAGVYPGDTFSVFQTPDFDSLTLETREKLENELCQVASLGFNRPLNTDFRADIARHIRGGFLQVALENKKPIAFAMSQYHEDIKTAYLAGLVKVPSAPRGVVREMVGEFIKQYHPSVLVTRTQNDRVMDIICHFCPAVVPLDRSVTPIELKLLASLDLLGPNTDLGLLITRGHYGGQMILDYPRRRSRDKKVTKFSDQLNYEAGDAALLIGYRQNI